MSSKWQQLATSSKHPWRQVPCCVAAKASSSLKLWGLVVVPFLGGDKAARQSMIPISQVCPGLDEPTAGQHAATAINYASVFHTPWFWNGVGQPATRK